MMNNNIKFPMQPIHKDDYGTIRFVENRMVNAILDNSTLDMNSLAMMGFTYEEQMQFAQLIGYSVSGFGSLSYVDKITCYTADNLAANINDLVLGELEMEIAVLEDQLKDVKDHLRKAAATVFDIGEEDLE